LFEDKSISPKDDEIKKMTLNAKIETIEEKSLFKNSVNKRCLIIANGFYEWQL
jgi:putative SOS response-associated peptidase YedK